MIALAAAAALLLYGIVLFNRLVARKNHALEAWSGIDVQLKRRHDLLPKLVAVVKAYASFEEKLLRDVTGARSGAGSAGERARTENALTGSGVIAVSPRGDRGRTRAACWRTACRGSCGAAGP